MSKLLMLSGLPASGKSTYAKELVQKGGGQWVRVNKDELRIMLHDDKFTFANEKVTVQTQKSIVFALLELGKSVIVDDTNLGKRHEEMWSSIAGMAGASFQKHKLKVPFEECLIRNHNRGLKVPQSAIHRMATQYKMIDGHWKEVVIVDLDGTVADLSHRLHWIKKENPTEEDYRKFYATVIIDKPIKEVIDKVREEYNAGRTIIFVSGRSDESRFATEMWLKQHIDFPYSALLMRSAGDRRPDTQVKKDFLRQTLKDYNIVRVYDDRPSVIRMWREDGLEVIDCGDGIEF